MIEEEMHKFGRFMVRERLQVLWLRGMAVLFAGLLVFAGGDVLFHASPMVRWVGCFFLLLALVGLVGATIWIKRQRLSPSALAVAIERYYPELDNHLVNYVQLSTVQGTSPLVDAYLQHDAPVLKGLDFRGMRDARKLRNSRHILAGALLLLALPLLVFGQGWTAALWRVVNPLSTLGPVTRTRILMVSPGDADVSQGVSMVLQVEVQGARGHVVRIEVDPADGRSTSHDLGMIDHAEPILFVHEIARVNTHFRYRFRAGDAIPSGWFQVSPLPPPSLSRLQALVQPPAYTGEPARRIDLLEERSPRIAAGSELILRAVCAVPMQHLSLSVAGGLDVEMPPVEGQMYHEARVRVDGPGTFRLSGADTLGRALDVVAGYLFVADAPPVIEVLEPQGLVLLPPGENPHIRFRVADDYGVAQIVLERVADGTEKWGGEIIKTWDADGERQFEASWRGALEPRSQTLTYRVTATDQAATGQTSYSELIVFSVQAAGDHRAEAERFEQAARDQLQRIIALQQTNITSSRQLLGGGAATDPAAWQERLALQTEIRGLTRTLLQNPIRPLGAKSEAVSSLYANEMLLAIHAIERIPLVEVRARDRQARTALGLQAQILAALQATSDAAERALLGRRQNAITGLLAAMIDGQSAIIERLRAQPTEGMLERLSQRQDALSEDVALFQEACSRESSALRGSDAPYAELLGQVLAESRARRIREDMLVAAEQLEQREAVGAVAPGQRAHANLLHLQRMLEQVAMRREEEQKSVMLEALQSASEKLEGVIDAHTKMQESMDAIRGARDEGDVDFDAFVEEFMALLDESKATLLEVPVDLHVFMDLNVANELVEDVFSVFQEVEQIAASKDAMAEDVLEIAFAKNLDALERMREMEDRFDAREMWIMEQPEWFAIHTEALDREEMPEAGIALGALAAAVEDLISELHEQTDEHREAAQDSATTHANPDFEDTGWAIIEGDISSFGAQGKSGGDRPDHKEQDGRSNVGRQGMASGETAAGSGTISEGDEDIQARRTEDPTQSGMVQLEGEADTRATGGGKLGSGKADDYGMDGGVARMDSTEEGSPEGMAALMARNAESLFAQASLKNVRVDSLHRAVEHLRQVEDAIARGNIGHVREHQRFAAAALTEARAELSAVPTAAIEVNRPVSVLGNALQVESEMAPPRFRRQVSDYFRILNEEL